MSYIKIPFAVSGDRTAVPDTSVDGTVNYTDGFGPDYAKSLEGDPDAKPIPREQMNEIIYEVYNAIRQYQQFSVPDFITTSDNGGTPFSYSIGAKVRYDPGSGAVVYTSLVNSNESLPTDATKWKQDNAFPAYSVLVNNANTPGASVGLPLAANQLIAAGADGIPAAYNIGTGFAFSDSDLIVFPPELPPGMIIDYAGTSIPTGWLACDGSQYSTTTYAALFAAIGYTWGTGTGSNFKVPDLRRYATIGSGGTAVGPVGNSVGDKGGAETVTLSITEMPSHTHGYPVQATSTVGSAGIQGGPGTLRSGTPSTDSAGSGGAHNNMQPSAVVMKIIKI